jgi:hypothetical protein
LREDSSHNYTHLPGAAFNSQAFYKADLFGMIVRKRFTVEVAENCQFCSRENRARRIKTACFAAFELSGGLAHRL